MSALLNCFHKRCLSLPRRKQERSRPVPIRAPWTKRAAKFGAGGKGKVGQKAGKKGTERKLGSQDGWGEGVSTARGICWGCRGVRGGDLIPLPPAQGIKGTDICYFNFKQIYFLFLKKKKKNKSIFFVLQAVKNKYSEMKAGFQEKNKRGNRKPTLLSAAESTTKPAFFLWLAAFLWRCGVSWGRAFPLKKAPKNCLP